VTGAFACHAAARNLTQFAMDARHQLIECRLITAPPSDQQGGNVGFSQRPSF
jgi:hypothetical protein